MTAQNPWGDDEELFDIPPPPPPPPPPPMWNQPTSTQVEGRGWNPAIFWLLLLVTCVPGVAYGFIAGNRRQRVRLGQWILGPLGALLFLTGRIKDPTTHEDSLSRSALGVVILAAFVVLTMWYARQRRAGRP